VKMSLGIDLGGTTTRVALVDEAGNILRAERRLLTRREPEDVIEQVVTLARGLDASALSLPVGVGVAAQLLVRTGMVAVAPNLGWVNVPLGTLLERAFGHPVRLVNDLDAFTVGEARCGAGRGQSDVIVLYLGTGLGAGALCQGLLIEGADGLATELGHTKVASPVTGRLCGCGERGCLEAYTSGRHLPELLKLKVAAGLASPLFTAVEGDLQRLNARNLEDAAVAGEPAASALWDDVALELGKAAAMAVTFMNPRVLVYGGGVLMNAPNLRERTTAVLRAYATKPSQEKLEIRTAELGDQAGLVGAGLLALEGSGAAPGRP
jgi:glucokinase